MSNVCECTDFGVYNALRKKVLYYFLKIKMQVNEIGYVSVNNESYVDFRSPVV